MWLKGLQASPRPYRDTHGNQTSQPGDGRESRRVLAGILVTGRPTEATRVGRVSKQMTTSDPLVWIDCEMTGLDLSADALIEVAIVVTDYELKPLADGIDMLIKPSPAAL